MRRKLEFEFVWEPVLAAIDSGAHKGMWAGANTIADKAKELAPKRTSALAISIQPMQPTGSLSGGDLEVRVAAAALYAPYVEFGTGIFGPHGTPIVPVNALALQIPLGGGEFMYRKSVKGMKAQPFLGPAMNQEAEHVVDELGAAIEVALIEYAQGV